MLYTKDNLQLMQELQSESIDLIYCDILYGTGKKFKDYQDLKADKKVIYDFYFQRINEMHRLLKTTGSIYIHCDCRISHWIRIMMDNAFGYANYIQTVYWKYDAGGNYKDKFKPTTDEILIYSKSENYTFNIDAVRIPHHKDTMRRINGYANAGITINPLGKQCESTWNINAVKAGNYTKANEEYVDYDTQKPKELLMRIVKASSNVGDVVADFFLGSGTTALVCKELNREFIGCDINPKAIQVTNERLQTSLF